MPMDGPQDGTSRVMTEAELVVVLTSLELGNVYCMSGPSCQIIEL